MTRRGVALLLQNYIGACKISLAYDYERCKMFKLQT